MSKYDCNQTVKVINSDDIVTIKGTRGNNYFIGQSWSYQKPPKYSYRIGSSLYIEEQYLEVFMNYKVGDKVWYLDLSTEIPRIRQDVIIREGYTCELQNYRENLTGGLISSTKLYPTKEALLAAIDPPLHNYTVGQTVWYIEEADDPDTLRVEKACVVSTTNDTVEISISHPCVPNFTFDDLDLVFDNPQDAVNKALELKQW